MRELEAADVYRCLTGDSGGPDRINLQCPCGSNYTHVVSVGTRLGSDEHEAVIYPGTVKTGESGHRRSAVEIVFACEGCPERFALVIQQHKGRNFIDMNAGV